MNYLISRLIWLYSIYFRATLFVYRRFYKYKTRLFKSSPLNILLSNQIDGIDPISSGFAYTSHRITFKQLQPHSFSKYDLVIPLNIDDSLLLDRHRNLLDNNLIAIPTECSVNLCDDKIKFNDFLANNGFGDYLPKISNKPELPFILKRNVDFSSKHAYMITDENQLKQHQDLIEDNEYFCQEIIPGRTEYAVHIYIRNGKIEYSLNIKYLFQSNTPVKAQDKTLAYKVCNSQYLDVFSDLLNAIGFEGICCINYKVKDGKPMILEINPRIGSSFFEFLYLLVNRLRTLS